MLPIDFLHEGLRRNPDAIAVEGETGEELTYRQLVRRVEAVAVGLQRLAPEPQSRVAICADNTSEHLVALLATMAAGQVWVPLNPRLGRLDIEGMIEATRPAVVVADESRVGLLPQVRAPLVVAKAEGGAPADGIAALTARFDGERPAARRLSPEDLQAIKFTSGSSGRAKGVMQSYRCWNTHIACMLHGFGFSGDDRFLVAAPLTHGTSCFMMPILAQGGRLVLIERARPAAILEAFARRDVSATFLPPTVIYGMLAEPEVSGTAYPKLRHLIYGAAPMPAEKIRAAQAVFGEVIEATYGQAEAPQIITYLRAHEMIREENLASAGRPSLLTRVAIIDGDGAFLGPDEPGEIVVRGDLLMNGYLDRPELTAETIVDGWLHTGDVGFMDERGYLFIKDRLRDVIISGGFNVYPADVEAILSGHPAVHECVVFGVPDDKWGERVEAAVEIGAGTEADAGELIGFVREMLGPVKAPKRIHFYAELPRSAVGKVLRREVKAAAEADGEPATETQKQRERGR
jgi:acyl-CoA synthetase (AMP-forming)/AMP-acid ligase II